MSGSEHGRSGRPSPPPGPGITRSKSFTGILTHKRSASSASNGPRSDTLPRSAYAPVLGQCHRGSAGSLRSLSMALVKMPKTPRPTRTAAIFEAIGRGLRECINVTEEDITSLKGSVEVLSVNSQQSQGRLYELEKQLKAAERYLKRLEYQLTALEELQDRYALQQKLRDGVRTMARAFVLSPGRERESALSNVRSGYKECVETLCCVEATLENLMGTLQLEMKGVQGFARLCAGDSFEITIRHGHQKWKTRGRILKNNQQTWDNEYVIFKALLGEVLHIKAVEMKSITKAVVLGNKYCDTKELFCANPQIMTVNLNSSGSLKLNVIITWNPLHGNADDAVRPQPIPKSSGSPACKKRTLPSHSLSHGSISSQVLSSGLHDGLYNGECQYSPDVDSRSVGSSHSSASARSSTISTPDADFHGDYPRLLEAATRATPGASHLPAPCVGRFPLKSTSLDSMPVAIRVGVAGTSPPRDEGTADRHRSYHRTHEPELGTSRNGRGSRSGQPSPVQLLHKADSSDCCSMDLGSSSQGSHLDGPSLPEVVQAMGSCLEDVQGQYPELYRLELITVELEHLVRGSNSRRGSHSSDISLSVESALECFDFLNTEVDEDDLDFNDDRLLEENDKTLDPELTAKTSDSGIASIARQLRGLNSSSPESGVSPAPPTTGSEQLDLALCTHLLQCQRLLENVGSFGPLKHRETQSLKKLKAQTTIIERLMKLARRLTEDKNASITGHDELKDDAHLQQLWDYCTDRGVALCVPADHCFHRLVARCQQQLQCTSVSEKVARHCVARLLDVTRFDSDAIVTVHQFSDYFWRNCSSGIDKHFEDLAEEVRFVEALQSANVSQVLQTIGRPSYSIPPPQCLLAMVTVLGSGAPRPMQDAVTAYLLEASKDNASRGRILDVLLEGLESDNAAVRHGVCPALACLKANEFIDQLTYTCQSDDSPAVRTAAKAALLSFGPEGRKAYDQSQLSSLGFQGLAIQ